MAARIPKVLKNFNVMVNGNTFAGVCESVTLPTLTIKEEDHRAGGMDGTIGIDSGMEKMTLKATFTEHNAALFGRFGLVDGAGTQFIFRGAQADDQTAQPYTVTASSALRVLAPSEATPGGKNTVEVTFTLTYYKLEINGQTVHEIDVMGMKRIINGRDVLQQMRQIIGA